MNRLILVVVLGCLSAFQAQAQFVRSKCYADLFGQYEGKRKILKSFYSVSSREDGNYNQARVEACKDTWTYCETKKREVYLRKYRPITCKIRPRNTTEKEVDKRRAFIDGHRQLPAGYGADDEFPYIEQPLGLVNDEGYPYSNFEGRLDEDHDLELHGRKLRDLLYVDGFFHPQKAQMVLNNLLKQKEQWRSSVGGSRYWRALEDWQKHHEKAQEEALERGDYPTNEAEEKLNESKSRLLYAFDLAINGLRELLEPSSAFFYQKLERKTANVEVGKNGKKTVHNSGRIKLRDKVATALLYLTLVDTNHTEFFLAGEMRLLLNSFRLWYKVEKDEGIAPASNLIVRHKGGGYRFLNPSELVAYSEKGGDLSKLSPPSSAFWTNNKVESFDPRKEVFYGYDDIFPAEGEVLTYTKTGNGGIKLHAKWKTKDGKKKKVKLRIARETHTTILAANLARAVGYPTIPSVFRDRVKLKMGKKKYYDQSGKLVKKERTYDEFIAEWIHKHGVSLGNPMNFIEQSEQDKKEGVVTLKNVCLEGYPSGDDEHRRLGGFRLGRNGFNNRREYRALLLLAALIDLNDGGDNQVRADVYKDPRTGEIKPYFFFSDIGYSMGPWFIFDNPGTVNGYRDWIATSAWYDSDQVNIWWNHSDYNVDVFAHTTYDDVKWLLRRYLRLSGKQIEEIVRGSGLPEPVVQVYAEKIKLRLHDLAQNFEMLDEKGLPKYISKIEELGRGDYRDFYVEALRDKRYVGDKKTMRLADDKTAEERKKTFFFSNYIETDGDINSEMISWSGNTTQLDGQVFWDWDFILVTLINAVRGQLHSYLSLDSIVSQLNASGFFSYQTGNISLGFLPTFRGSHVIEENTNLGEYQYRYRVKSSYTIEIPVGIFAADENLFVEEFKLSAPLNAFKRWKFDHYSSYKTKYEAATAVFHQSSLPGMLGVVKGRMASQAGRGEILDIENGVGFGIGRLSGNYGEFLRFDASLLSYDYQTIRRMRITKPNDKLWEVAVLGQNDHTVQSGIDIRAFLKLTANARWTWGESKYRLYRFDFNNKPLRLKNEMTVAFLDILNHNSFWMAEEYQLAETTAEGHKVLQEYNGSEQNLGFIAWGRGNAFEVRDFVLSKFSLITESTNSVEKEKNEQTIPPQWMKEEKNRVIVAKNLSTKDFSLVGMNEDPLNLSGGENILNILLAAFDELTYQTIQFEGVVNKQETGFSEMNLIIRLDRFHKWVNEEDDFNEYFRDFFNQRAKAGGDPRHITKKWKVNHLPVRATMYWQLNEKAISKILAGLKESANTTCFIPVVGCRDHNNARSGQQKWNKKIGNRMSSEDKLIALKAKAEGLVDMIKHFVGDDGENLGSLRNYLKDDSEDFLMFTRIMDLVEDEVPVAIGQVDYYTKRVGKFPRPTFIDRWKFANNYRTHRNPGFGAVLDPFDGGSFGSSGLGGLFENFSPATILSLAPGGDGNVNND